MAFERRLINGVAQVKTYEDVLAQTCARSVMDVDAIDARARGMVVEATGGVAVAAAAAAAVATARGRGEEEASGGEIQLSFEDARLLALLRWFKQDFFTWVNVPSCAWCASTTTTMTLDRIETREMTAEEREGEAGRVEVYACDACGLHTRFPRYNNAVKLLETRRGRCGEWANAFTLCCRALGYRARWVCDWTDHVWTEVYSEAQQRWLHCDPCEDVCDKPLLYEVGWGKSELSYIIAFSIEGVVDVTKRYTRDIGARYRRRGEVYEPWLRERLALLTEGMRAEMLPSEIEKLKTEDELERQELERPAMDVGESLPGRSTGSYAWRAARGELGNQNS